MELVATLESHLKIRLKDPETPLDTVREVVDWVNANAGG
jgi:acyl carrier protein